MTIVKTGDIIRRGDKTYEVIIADENIFVIAPKSGSQTYYDDKLEAYSNLPSINTLSDLNFEKVGE